jgi:hypothetical protein
MKLSSLNVSAICIFIGLGGFFLGKFTSRKAELSGQDRLLDVSERKIQQRPIDGEDDSRNSEPSNRSSRFNRPTQQRDSTRLAQKLVKLEAISRDNNPLTRGRAMLDWIDSLAPDEFEAAVDRVLSLGMSNQSEVFMLLAAWAEVDPISALAYTVNKDDGEYGEAAATVLGAWASRDVDAAIAWAKSNHKGDEANPYFNDIISGIVATDPDRATALLQELPFGMVRAEAFDIMTPHLVEIGEEAAKKWISELGDQRLRSGAIARLAEALAEKDPAGSATWLLENINERTVLSVDAVFSQWAEVDPAAAISNFENIKDEEARSRALAGIVVQDAAKNPQATLDLMNRFPNDLTDNTVQRFILTTYRVKPNLAVEQISKIQSEAARNHMYRRTLNSWLQQDEVAAKNWINSANLPSSVVENLDQR